MPKWIKKYSLISIRVGDSKSENRFFDDGINLMIKVKKMWLEAICTF
jgi:hypothetical protein